MNQIKNLSKIWDWGENLLVLQQEQGTNCPQLPVTSLPMVATLIIETIEDEKKNY